MGRQIKIIGLCGVLVLGLALPARAQWNGAVQFAPGVSKLQNKMILTEQFTPTFYFHGGVTARYQTSFGLFISAEGRFIQERMSANFDWVYPPIDSSYLNSWSAIGIPIQIGYTGKEGKVEVLAGIQPEFIIGEQVPYMAYENFNLSALLGAKFHFGDRYYVGLEGQMGLENMFSESLIIGEDQGILMDQQVLFTTRLNVLLGVRLF